MSNLMDEVIKATNLCVRLVTIVNSWYGMEIVAFIKGQREDCLYFDKLKPLYDEYGYTTVNESLLVVYEKLEEIKKEEKKNEQSTING